MVQFLLAVRRMNALTREAQIVIAIEGDYTPPMGFDLQRACADVRAHLGNYKILHGVKNNPALPVVMKGSKTPAYVAVAQVAGRTGRLQAAARVEQSFKDPGVSGTLLDVLVQQLRQYRLTLRKLGKDRVRSTQDPRYSGKEAGRDDLAVAWLAALYHLVMYYLEHRKYIVPGMSLVPGVRDSEDGPDIDALEKDMAYAASLKIPSVEAAIQRLKGSIEEE